MPEFFTFNIDLKLQELMENFEAEVKSCERKLLREKSKPDSFDDVGNRVYNFDQEHKIRDDFKPQYETFRSALEENIRNNRTILTNLTEDDYKMPTIFALAIMYPRIWHFIFNAYLNAGLDPHLVYDGNFNVQESFNLPQPTTKEPINLKDVSILVRTPSPDSSSRDFFLPIKDDLDYFLCYCLDSSLCSSNNKKLLLAANIYLSANGISFFADGCDLRGYLMTDSNLESPALAAAAYSFSAGALGIDQRELPRRDYVDEGVKPATFLAKFYTEYINAQRFHNVSLFASRGEPAPRVPKRSMHCLDIAVERYLQAMQAADLSAAVVDNLMQEQQKNPDLPILNLFYHFLKSNCDKDVIAHYSSLVAEYCIDSNATEDLETRKITVQGKRLDSDKLTASLRLMTLFVINQIDPNNANNPSLKAFWLKRIADIAANLQTELAKYPYNANTKEFVTELQAHLLSRLRAEAKPTLTAQNFVKLCTEFCQQKYPLSDRASPGLTA